MYGTLFHTYIAVFLLVGVQNNVGVPVVELAILVLGPVGNLHGPREQQLSHTRYAGEVACGFIWQGSVKSGFGLRNTVLAKSTPKGREKHSHTGLLAEKPETPRDTGRRPVAKRTARLSAKKLALNLTILQIWIPTFSPAPFHAGSVSAAAFLTCREKERFQAHAHELNCVTCGTHLLLRVGAEQREVAVLPVVLLGLHEPSHGSLRKRELQVQNEKSAGESESEKVRIFAVNSAFVGRHAHAQFDR